MSMYSSDRHTTTSSLLHRNGATKAERLSELLYFANILLRPAIVRTIDLADQLSERAMHIKQTLGVTGEDARLVKSPEYGRRVIG
ncbi:hypothetical protein Trydic_g8711 [Trypoxylus dichotomus]